MSTEPITDQQRFSRRLDQVCPICGGCSDDPQGEGVRCFGFMSGGTARCTREDFAKGIPLNGDNTSTFTHVLNRECRCDTRHPAPSWWQPDLSTFPYVENGIVIGTHMRRDWPDGKKDMWWTDLNGRAPAALPLYGADALDLVPPNTPIVIVEGEKKRDMLMALGIAAVGTATGAPMTHTVEAFKPLLGYPVIVWGDADEKGQQQRTANAARLLEIGHPNVLKIPDGTPAPDDYLDAGNTIEQLLALLDQAVPATARASTSPSSKPEITVSGDLTDMTEQGWDVIVQTNTGPTLFQRSTIGVRLERDDDGYLMTKALTETRLRHELARAATWMIRTDDGAKEVYPPIPIVQDMLACPQLPLPVLDRIVEVPTFTASGKLRLEPGYDPDGRTFYQPPDGLNIPPVPDQPTAQQIRDAVALILEVFEEFDVVGPADTAHAVALMLQPFVRELIKGPVPCHVFDAPTPGTGKSLMARAALLPFLGRTVSAMPPAREEEEWRKRIGAKIMQTTPVVFVDNMKTGVSLDSASLAMAITSYPKWEDRRLGVSEVPQMSIRNAWVVTGNNISMSMEMARRSVRTRQVSPDERPWLRTGWRHDPLEDWILAERGRLIHACLTLGKAWIAAGRPTPAGKTLGMFESWVRVIGGILMVAEISGFLENIEDLYAEADLESGELREFFTAWRAKYGDQGVTAEMLVTLETGLPAEVIEANDRTAKLRYYLRGIKDKAMKLEKNGPTYVAKPAGKTRVGVVVWKLTIKN